MDALINKLQTIRPITFDTIVDAARELLPLNHRNAPWLYTGRGTVIYDQELQLNCYIAAYSKWHEWKLSEAFSTIPDGFFAREISIIDWGCGQGLGSLFVLLYIKNKNLNCRVNEIILIEPSVVAIERAKCIISLVDENVSIRCINKVLDDVSADEILLRKKLPIFQIFSNILDVEGVDLKHLSNVFYVNRDFENYLICCCPYYYTAVRRTNAFLNYIRHPLQFEKTIIQSDKRPYGYTYYINTLKLEGNNVDQIIKYEFYPPVQFRGASQLDSVWELLKQERVPVDDIYTYFDVYAPFDFGASISDDINPIVAIVNNIVTRGLPTKASPFVERSMLDAFQKTREISEFGAIKFESCFDSNSVSKLLEIFETGKLTDDVVANQLYFTPLAITRIQKTLIEALCTNRLSFDKKVWTILVEEEDVPCAALALRDLQKLINTISSLSIEYKHICIPEIKLDIISNNKYLNSPLHKGCRVYSSCDQISEKNVYDVVIHYSSSNRLEECNFEKYNVRNNLCFAIYNATEKKSRRFVYTTDSVEYEHVVENNERGIYNTIETYAIKLRFVLSYVFRKRNFRPGQLPILNRALANKSVIGLLPTGGGKSLTYQLAAMLQPGISLVIDPLTSLMKDQYDGLINLGIDCCTFINSLVTDKAAREQYMEQSNYLFVFLSPERLCIRSFRDRLRNMQDLNVYFSYGIIDEVHCVSEWGHDFRFSYLHLGRNLYKYVLPKQNSDGSGHISLFGLTATASFDVLADVERELSGNGAFPLDSDAIIRYENTNRLELQYQVVKIDAYKENNKWGVYKLKNNSVPDVLELATRRLVELQEERNVALIKSRFIERENITDEFIINKINNTDLEVNVHDEWVNEQPNLSSAIVFCPHRQGSLGVYDTMKNHGVASSIRMKYGNDYVSTFVGGEQLDGQEQFIKGYKSIMVATKAFGMGIDKSNVRFTVNVNHSGSLEAFVQEAGRAGRDGKMSLATILYCPKEFVEKDKRTRTQIAVPVDYGVHKFFYDGNFIGGDFEKIVMFYLLSRNSLRIGNEEIEHAGHAITKSVRGFMDELVAAEVGTNLVSYISYSVEDNAEDIAWVNELLEKHNYPTFELGNVSADQKNWDKETVGYTASIEKAIYRMCCVGIVDDYTRDYQEEYFRIVTIKKTDDEYYQHLRDFLLRYYAVDRAELEMRRAMNYKGDNAMQKCLGYITEFVYSKIATKRKRAIQDIEDFCYDAVTRQESWLDTNEHLKDYIYFYFNSKYAREGYTTELGLPYSLTDDTEGGKISSFELLFKYMGVVSDEVVGSSGSPKDNIKHLQGAVRIIRRALTDSNPALDLLNAYCLMYLKIGDNKNLKMELEKSYKEGYLEFRNRTTDYSDFYKSISTFKTLMLKYNAIDNNDLSIFHKWEIEVELNLHAERALSIAKTLTE